MRIQGLRFLAPLWLLGLAGLHAQSLPPGFQRTDPITGRTQPTGVYFAHDGRVFVTEKSGLVWVYQNLTDPGPTVFADVSANVHDFWDRGLLGFALDPRFPERPYVYVQYSYNPGPPPRWPATNCPTPPGATTNGGGCVISGRVSRLTVTGDTAGSEEVRLEDWYQQFPSHSIGTIQFGPDGYLYAGGGDGASFNGTDYGQWGNPDYPDDRAPANQGGALRAQGLEIEDQYNAAGHDVWLNGTISRIDPETGEGAPGNPLGADPRPNARRIIAYGLRNPFRFTFRPGTNGELWVGDVGYGTWEEINVIPTLAGGNATLKNFGWPCYEGRVHTNGYSTANLAICNGLYIGNDTGGRTPWSPPWYTYVHQGASDITGLAFYEGSSYPAAYRNSLFFADNSRTIIFNIPYADANGDGLPDPPADSSATAFYGGSSATAVQLTTGPGGDLFYANINTGRISRISYCDGCSNRAPSAAIALDAGSDADGAPRTIAFTASNSVDPDGDGLAYDWDLDGDGNFGDAAGATASLFFGANGAHTVSVRASDGNGGSDIASMIVTVVNNAPTVTILTPASGFLWSAGETVNVTASSSDPEQGTLPDASLAWQVFREDCTNPDFTGCTETMIDTFTGASNAFTAPDAAFPAYLRIVLTGTDNGGLTGSDEVDIYPATADLTLMTDPAGLMVGFGGTTPAPAPVSETVIVNASVEVDAPTPQTSGGTEYEFASWSDGGEASHVVHVPAPGTAALTASFLAPADIALALDDGMSTVMPGETVVWTLTVDDAGVNDVSGIAVTTAFPAALTNVSWICIATPGSGCGAGGGGAPSDTANLQAGGHATYTITATVAASATGSVTVDADAALPAGYLNLSPNDDRASDTDTIDNDRIFADGFESS